MLVFQTKSPQLEGKIYFGLQLLQCINIIMLSISLLNCYYSLCLFCN